MLCREVRPQHIEEEEFRIGQLPQQEVGNALFPAGADQKIDIGQAMRVEGLLEGCIVDGVRIDLAVPRGPPSPPVPVMHSPPRKVTVKDQQDCAYHAEEPGSLQELRTWKLIGKCSLDRVAQGAVPV